jgi:hypothetical protein
MVIAPFDWIPSHKTLETKFFTNFAATNGWEIFFPRNKWPSFYCYELCLVRSIISKTSTKHCPALIAEIVRTYFVQLQFRNCWEYQHKSNRIFGCVGMVGYFISMLIHRFWVKHEALFLPLFHNMLVPINWMSKIAANFNAFYHYVI